MPFLSWISCCILFCRCLSKTLFFIIVRIISVLQTVLSILKSTVERFFILILVIEFKLLSDSLEHLSVLMSLKWSNLSSFNLSRVAFENGVHLESLISNMIGFQSSLSLPNLHNLGQRSADVNIGIDVTWKFGVAILQRLKKLIWILALIYTFHRFHELHLIAVII